MAVFAHSKPFLFKLGVITSVQKYIQIKNQELLEFLKNNQLCSIKKASIKKDGNTMKKRDTKKINTKKWNI